MSEEILHRLPPRLLPILYFAWAHVALTIAFTALAADPRSIMGFYYHPKMLALVHLLTLGWISGSILGSLYIVGPMALRTTIPAGAVDYWAWALVTIGTMGMASHFWLETYSGMAWSGAMTTTGLGLAAWTILPRIWRAPIDLAVKLHVVFAFANLGAAAALGILLGFDKQSPFLPGYVLDRVGAHAHLAALGWAVMMVAGVGYRLLPMVLPSAMPRGASLYASLCLLQAGVTGLTVVLFAGWPATPLFAALIVAGIAAFLGHVLWMMRHRRPAPPAFVGADETVAHVRQALLSLLIATAIGLTLVWTPDPLLALRLVMAYGVFGLAGFLARLIAGLQIRILPTFAWYWAFAGSDGRAPVPAPPAMLPRTLSRAGFWLWTAGVPVLAAGLAVDAIALVRGGAALLLAAVLAGAATATAIVRHAYAGRDRLP